MSSKSIVSLPTEIINLIFNEMRVDDVLNSRLTCRDFDKLAKPYAQKKISRMRRSTLRQIFRSTYLEHINSLNRIEAFKKTYEPDSGVRTVFVGSKIHPAIGEGIAYQAMGAKQKEKRLQNLGNFYYYTCFLKHIS